VARQVIESVQSTLFETDIRVDFAFLGDEVRIGSRDATVLALVINELVDNALTHGLGIEGGRIEVEAVLKHGQVVVEVRDDGPRHPAPPPRQSSGLGLQIIETLVKGDLNGSFSLTRDVEAGWTRARICFPQRIIDEERIEG
jgi:two-component sensor histidine kinase